jgi:adenylate kinase
MLIDEVNKHPDTNGILFDGYPRTLSQAIALDAFMISIDSRSLHNSIRADDEILIQRLLERGKTSGRIDDQDEDKIRNRYQDTMRKQLL